MKRKTLKAKTGAKLPKALLVLMLLTVVFSGLPKTTRAQPVTSREYLVKAAFLYNFAKFVQWPQGAFKDADAPLVLCILGDDPFGSALNVLAGKTVGGRRLVIQRARNLTGLAPCHILFVASLRQPALRQVLGKVKGKPILTVSEIPDFTHQGGIIQFFTVQSKIRFEINPAAAAANDLKVSSQLLKLARIRREN